MKKLLLLLCAFVASVSGAWGQEPVNLAQGKTAIATSGDASQAVDGNSGTRWESAFSDPQTWQVDLGSAQTFNTISILWEGGYGKSFTIEVGDNVDGDGYLTGGTSIVNVDNQVLEGFPKTQVFTFENKTARYIKFIGTARGTGYGYSFWEFGVYSENIVPALNTLTIATASPTTVAPGANISFTASGKDQLGGNIATGTVTWTSSNPSVGTITDGAFTAVAAGTTTITAAAGGKTSNSIEVTVIAGSKVDLFTNWQYRIYPLGADTKTVGRDGLVDANEASLWELHGETGGDEVSRTYDTGFIADLGGIYDVSTILIKFEGACSADYTISFAGDNGVFGSAAYTVTNHAGMATYTEEHTGESVTGARYVKFLSTKAATQWGVKIFDFSVIGTKTAEAAINAGTPTISSATFVSPTDNSLTLNITTTDDAPYVLYQITGVGADRLITGKTGVAESFVLGGLEEGTNYTASIIAYDAAAHGSAISSPSGTTTGGVADETAPTMTKAEVTTVGATTVRLTVSATDNVAGTLTYNVKKGDDVVGTGSGAAGEDVIIDVVGLTAETTYPAGTFKVTATDASSNTASAMDVGVFTTIEKPMGAELSEPIKSTADDLNGKLLNYTFVFTQTGMNVTATFSYTNGSNSDGQGITGLVDGYTIHDGEEAGGLSYTWENCTVGQKLTAQHKWLFYGGDHYTPTFTYVVVGENAGLMKEPADANGINEVLGTGAITADAFKALTTAEEKIYDLRNLKVTSAVTLEANNPNAVFIVKDAVQKANLAGTKNMVIWNAGESRYEGDIEIVDQNNANTFATNLPIYATSVSYTRNVAADKYVTIALPFTPTTTTTGFSAYAVDGDVSAGKINFQKTTTGMIAGTAYMLHNTGDAATDFVASASEVVLNFTEGTSGLFRSVFNAKSLTDGDNAYILSGGKFKHALTGASIGGFRGYIYYAGSPSRELEITIDGNVTGINDVKGKTEEGHGVMYNLQGQEVKNPAKGIYIMNGKKFIKR